MVDKMTTGGTNCATYTVHGDLERDRRDNELRGIQQTPFAAHSLLIRPQPPHSAAHHQSFMPTTDDAKTFLKNCGNSILVNFGAIKVSSRDSSLLVSNCCNVRTSPHSATRTQSQPKKWEKKWKSRKQKTGNQTKNVVEMKKFWVAVHCVHCDHHFLRF